MDQFRDKRGVGSLLTAYYSPGTTFSGSVQYFVFILELAQVALAALV
jgi:hypothetical protein